MSVGILGLLGADEPQGAGILGNGILTGASPSQTGILSGINGFARDNQAALLNMGGSLLSGEGFGAGLRGFAQGMQQDQRTRLLQQAKAEKERNRLAARQEAEKHGIDPAVAEANPDLVWQIAAKKYMPREPSEWERLTKGLSPEEYKRARDRKLFGDTAGAEWDVIGEDEYGNKRYGWVDKRNRSITPYQGQPDSGSAPSSGLPSGGPFDGSDIPPPPPGVNPRVWRDEQTRIAANAGKQSEKMRTDLANARRSAESLKEELRVFEKMVDQHGAELAPGADKAAMQTTYTDIQMQLKNLYELGAITGPDMAILGQLLENPTADGFGEYVGKSINRGSRTKAQIRQMQRIIDNSLASAERNLGAGKRSGAPGSAQGAINGQTRSGVTWSAR